MDAALPEPGVVSCFFDDHFHPRLPAMCLDWSDEALRCRIQSWHLPEDLSLTSAVPSRFGVDLRRYGPDEYAVRLLWNDSRFQWDSLTRAQLLQTSLPQLLAAMGTDLQYLLQQPVDSVSQPTARAQVG
jgi:hypothetical protein